MQIILLERIGGPGNLDDIVTVKNGYARNFLILSDRAKRATEASMQESEVRRTELEARRAEISADAKVRQEKLDSQTIAIAQKVSMDGCLLGSVANADITAAVVAPGIEAVKTNVRLPSGPLEAVDEYELEVVLRTGMVTKTTVAVAAAAVE